MLVGLFGPQRSGKTLMAYLLAESYRKKGATVYTNMICPDFNTIESLAELPLDGKPKILLLDEVYYFMDSRTHGNDKQIQASIFFNTLGKNQTCLILTAINHTMIEKRLRDQLNYVYFVKSDTRYIYYKFLDVHRNRKNEFKMEKTQELFRGLNYDTKQIPNLVDLDLDDFEKRVKLFNKIVSGQYKEDQEEEKQESKVEEMIIDYQKQLFNERKMILL